MELNNINKVKIISVNLPEYTIDKEPNYLKLGGLVDIQIEQNFEDGWYYERALSMEDHPNMSADELINIIVSTGTDRYDTHRKSVCHDQFAIYDYDLHLGSFKIKNQKIEVYEEDEQPTMFGNIIYNFYKHAPKDRGRSLRIDLVVLYNPDMFEKAKKIEKYNQQPDHKFADYLYSFKSGIDKSKSVVGVIKILR